MVVSCDKTKSYTDMLKAQEKAIDRLRADSGLVFLEEFPTDSIFKENEFVELDNGVYLNIVNKGNVNVRYWDKRRSVPVSSPGCLWKTVAGELYRRSARSNSNGTHPVEFRYGYYTSLNPDYSYTWDMFICEGLGAGLPYVGDSAVVKLIVPFKLMSSDFQSSGTPVFFEKVKYTFIK